MGGLATIGGMNKMKYPRDRELNPKSDVVRQQYRQDRTGSTWVTPEGWADQAGRVQELGSAKSYIRQGTMKTRNGRSKHHVNSGLLSFCYGPGSQLILCPTAHEAFIPAQWKDSDFFSEADTRPEMVICTLHLCKVELGVDSSLPFLQAQGLHHYSPQWCGTSLFFSS